MKTILAWLMNPSPEGPPSTLLLRLMAGGVFLWEGILKFVYVNQGVGRFTKLGMPFPHFTADFVGYLEIVGGILLLSGLMTADCDSVHHRDDRGHPVDENLVISRDIAIAFAAVAAAVGNVGGFA